MAAYRTCSGFYRGGCCCRGVFRDGCVRKSFGLAKQAVDYRGGAGDVVCVANAVQYARKTFVCAHVQRTYHHCQVERRIVAYAGVFVVFGVYIRHCGRACRRIGMYPFRSGGVCRYGLKGVEESFNTNAVFLRGYAAFFNGGIQ